MTVTGLTTDFYELTMAQGYFLKRKQEPAVFDMFFRSHPFEGGFTVFAGLDPLLEYLEMLHFDKEDIEYLDAAGLFRREFLEYLARFRFSGDLFAVSEGTLVFPNEPIIRVHADIIEAQLIESLLLNIINFQTLIATKSARIFLASKEGTVLEFGLRRAQGLDGAFSAARASYIGGAAATSNSAAARQLGIPAKGTMAHSWILAFDSELEAFHAYADIYPDSSIFLIDTYSTLKSGIGNAIAVGRELAGKGKSFGVRLDSGDLLELSRQVRRRLDEAGFPEATIAVSNELDEWEITRLVEAGAPIDIWGVGTHLVTGGNDSALTGVYKLAAKGTDNKPVMKFSESAEKSTNPGIKQICRCCDTNGKAVEDIIYLSEEPVPPPGQNSEPLLQKKMKDGRRLKPPRVLGELRRNTINNFRRFDSSMLSLSSASEYPVSLSDSLKAMKDELIRSYEGAV